MGPGATLYDAFDVPYYAAKALQVMEHFLRGRVTHLERTGVLHYDKAGNYLPERLQSKQPFAVASGWVGAIRDFNDNEQNPGEGRQWCAHCSSKVRENQTDGAPQTLSGYVRRATWHLSYYKWRQLCENCNDLFKIDELEYQLLKTFYQDNHNVVIPPREKIVTTAQRRMATE